MNKKKHKNIKEKGEQGMPAEAMECDKVNCKVQCTNYGKQVAINFFFNCKIYTHKKMCSKDTT